MTSLPDISLPITSQWRSFAELSAAELYELLRFRQLVFVVAQRSPYPDLDGRDQDAAHLVLRAGSELAGCLRLSPPAEAAPVVRIGRVAVAAPRRGHGLGRLLMAEALACCRDRYPGAPVGLGAQLYLRRFYESFGFAAVSAPYDDFGVPHIEMRIAA
jgi:ElaA protein